MHPNFHIITWSQEIFVCVFFLADSIDNHPSAAIILSCALLALFSIPDLL